MCKKIFFVLLVLLSISFAQDDDLLVVDDFSDGTTDEEILEADWIEGGSVKAKRDTISEDSVYTDADLEELSTGKTAQLFSEKKMHFGGRAQLGLTFLEDKMYGAGGDAGVAFCYFFYKKLAIQTGLEFRSLVMRSFYNHDKVMYDDKSARKDYIYVQNYTITFMGVSLPLALRFGNRFWGEFGFQFDYVGSWTDYAIPPELEYGLSDPFKPETTLYPSLLAGFGVNMPTGNWKVDLGVQASFYLSDIETDYEESDFPLFSEASAVCVEGLGGV